MTCTLLTCVSITFLLGPQVKKTAKQSKKKKKYQKASTACAHRKLFFLFVYTSGIN